MTADPTPEQLSISQLPNPPLTVFETRFGVGLAPRDGEGNVFHDHPRSKTSRRPATSTQARPSHNIERTPHACDECRQRKIKCDGQSPCKHCSISFYDCTYAEPPRKRRKRPKTSEQFEALENRLKEMERCLKMTASSATPAPRPNSTSISESSCELPVREDQASVNDQASFPDPIGNATTQYAIEQGEMGYQGYSSDRAFILRMREKLGDWAGEDIGRRLRPRTGPLPRLFEPDSSAADQVSLPSKEAALKLVACALDTHALVCITHRPSFDYHFNVIYTLNPSDFSAEEYRFLPLLYSVLALGCLFQDSETGKSVREHATTRATKYFAASRRLADLADCPDLMSLQAIVFLNVFLLCTVRITTCYTYILHAVSLALRMGIHRSISQSNDLVEREVRRRVFWAVRSLSSNVATALGLPKLLSDDDIDQEMPMDINDIYIEKSRILPQPAREVSTIAGSIAYIKLHHIMEMVIKFIYPIRGMKEGPRKDSMSYMVSVSKVREIEKELQDWRDNLPLGFRLGRDTSPKFLRIQYMLCMSYAHVQLMLYRPFLHYLSRSKDDERSRTDLSSCAAACVKVSQNIIHLNEDMCRRGVPIGAYWTAVHMTNASILSLIYVVLDPTNIDGAETIFKDMATGRKVLDVLACHSTAADRCRTVLKILTALLPNEHQRTRERLQNYESEVPNLKISTEILGHSNNDAHTTSLANSTFGIWEQRSLVGHGSPETRQLSSNMETTGNISQASISERSRVPSPIPRQPIQQQQSVVEGTSTQTNSNSRSDYSHPAFPQNVVPTAPAFAGGEPPISTAGSNIHEPFPNAPAYKPNYEYEYLEAQPFNFPSRTLVGASESWSNTNANPFGGASLSNILDGSLPDMVTDEQMMPGWTTTDMEEFENLFSFEDLV